MTSILVKIGALAVDATNYELPTERTFRDAWSFGGNPEAGVIVVDMAAAREIWRDKIRQAREPRFAELDAAFIRALESGADTSDIVLQKQLLRDAPSDPAIDAAQTPDELKLVQPAGLNVV